MKERIFFVNKLLLWDEIREIERRYKIILVLAIVLAIVISMILSAIDVPEKDRSQEKLPDRIAKMVLEKKKEPPPPPPEPEIEEEPEEVEKEPEPEPEPEKAKEEAKKKVTKMLKDLAMLDDLRDMAPITPRKLSKSAGKEAKIDRSIITSRVNKGSGGIRVAKASSGGGGGADLAGAQIAQVKSSVDDNAITRKVSASGKMRRTTEEIRRTIDRHAGAINSIYQRALRKNPALEGTVVFRFSISAEGEITAIEIVSSDLQEPALEQKLLRRMKMITFEPGNIEVWNDTYPLNFFPA